MSRSHITERSEIWDQDSAQNQDVITHGQRQTKACLRANSASTKMYYTCLFPCPKMLTHHLHKLHRLCLHLSYSTRRIHFLSSDDERKRFLRCTFLGPTVHPEPGSAQPGGGFYRSSSLPLQKNISRHIPGFWVQLLWAQLLPAVIYQVLFI